jgi:DNA-binding phage protein
MTVKEIRKSYPEGKMSIDFNDNNIIFDNGVVFKCNTPEARKNLLMKLKRMGFEQHNFEQHLIMEQTSIVYQDLDNKDNAKLMLKAVQKFASENNITQQIISDKTGFVQSDIARMFSGVSIPSIEKFIKVCDAVGLKIQIINKN